MNRGLNIDAARAALGRPVLNLDQLFADKRALFGDATMTAGGQGDAGGAGAGGAGTGAGAGGAGAATYDEAHVQRVAAAQKAEGERVAAAKYATLLGMTPEEAKAKLDKATETERAAMNEAERKAAEAAEAKAAADKQTADAKVATTAAKVTEHLLLSGVDLGDDKATADYRAERLAMTARLVSVEPGADDAAIKAAIERVKKNVPQLFTAGAAAAGAAGGGQGDQGAGPAGHQQAAGAFGKGGDAEYERRFGKATAGATAT